MLSVLIPTLPQRKEYLEKLLSQIDDQLGEFKETTITDPNYTIKKRLYNGVEVIICEDDKKLKVGSKRNLLKRHAKGTHFTFIDDDDRIATDYFSSLTDLNTDVTVFDAVMTTDEKFTYHVKYGTEYGQDKEAGTIAYRLPNHLMVWDRKFLKVQFPNIQKGEDAAWAKRARQMIKSQKRIDKVLYYYDFNTNTTETQK